HKRAHELWRVLCALNGLVWLSTSAMAASSSASPSASPGASPAASPPATLTQEFSELSAQRAAAERSKIYRAGAAYSRWLDQVAKDSVNAFLQRPVFDRVTSIRLLTCPITLAIPALLTGCSPGRFVRSENG